MEPERSSVLPESKVARLVIVRGLETERLSVNRDWPMVSALIVCTPTAASEHPALKFQ